jgi:hypothetical protein
MNFEEIKIPNPGLLSSTMPDEVYEELKASTTLQISNKNVSNKLKRSMVIDVDVQGIEESIVINLPESYKNYIHDLSKRYYDHFNLDNFSTPYITASWLNLQKQYEYRPVHRHSDGQGRGLSFVTYLKIPFDKNEEDNYKNHNKSATRHRNGRIEFIYNRLNGLQDVLTIDLDKTHEGKTLIFTNSLLHIVYPFYTTTDYRISLAGNVQF